MFSFSFPLFSFFFFCFLPFATEKEGERENNLHFSFFNCAKTLLGIFRRKKELLMNLLYVKKRLVSSGGGGKALQNLTILILE